MKKRYFNLKNRTQSILLLYKDLPPTSDADHSAVARRAKCSVGACVVCLEASHPLYPCPTFLKMITVDRWGHIFIWPTCDEKQPFWWSGSTQPFHKQIVSSNDYNFTCITQPRQTPDVMEQLQIERPERVSPGTNVNWKTFNVVPAGCHEGGNTASDCRVTNISWNDRLYIPGEIRPFGGSCVSGINKSHGYIVPPSNLHPDQNVHSTRQSKRTFIDKLPVCTDTKKDTLKMRNSDICNNIYDRRCLPFCPKEDVRQLELKKTVLTQPIIEPPKQKHTFEYPSLQRTSKHGESNSYKSKNKCIPTIVCDDVAPKHPASLVMSCGDMERISSPNTDPCGNRQDFNNLNLDTYDLLKNEMISSTLEMILYRFTCTLNEPEMGLLIDQTRRRRFPQSIE
uniref:Uncharacterized protein n=1 Tax=Timema bartmani TaxID=61472 RepID=A0A7R9F8V5_9NEOP|nr:unnamed protein product [Timema bartmani]